VALDGGLNCVSAVLLRSLCRLPSTTEFYMWASQAECRDDIHCGPKKPPFYFLNNCRNELILVMSPHYLVKCRPFDLIEAILFPWKLDGFENSSLLCCAATWISDRQRHKIQ